LRTQSTSPARATEPSASLAWIWLIEAPLRILFSASKLNARDHAGTQVLVRARIKAGEIPPHDRKRVHEVYERVRLRMGGQSVLAFPLLPVILSIVVISNVARRSLSQSSTFDVVFAGFLVAWMVWGWAAHVLARKFILPGPTIPGDVDEVAKCWLAERHCPSCLYDLTQTDPAEDGLTRCPECAHRWRIGGATTIPRDGST
jgi:hypothetical protein